MFSLLFYLRPSGTRLYIQDSELVLPRDVCNACPIRIAWYMRYDVPIHITLNGYNNVLVKIFIFKRFHHFEK